MPPPADNPHFSSRRRALSLLVNAVGALFGASLAALLGVFAVRPARGAAADRWIRAGTLDDLVPDRPVPRVLSIPRVDGWYRGRARETVFLVWTGDREVRAFSATCTHLGCQVLWDAPANRFRCPCHGGVYDAAGQVMDGPPPRPLATLETRVESADKSVLVRL
jgi:Rieske Fe-S protein